MPATLASMRKAGLKYDIMTTSFFLGRRTIKESPSSEMPVWQDKLYVALTKQAAVVVQLVQEVREDWVEVDLVLAQ